jgi:hypothetical protein
MRFKKNYGGGGGTTTSSIPEWAQPYLKNVGNATEAAYGAGELGKVAGASQLQSLAFNQGAGGLWQNASDVIGSGRGTVDRATQLAKTGGADELKDALKLDIGMSTANMNNQFGASGTLGSARHALATSAADSAAKAKYAQSVIDNKLKGEQTVGAAGKNIFDTSRSVVGDTANLGNQQRGIDQQGLDATYQGLQRYASTIYGNPARQQASGGGK